MLTLSNFENFILNKSIQYIDEMPKNIYSIYFLIHTNESNNNIPTLSLQYNTLNTLTNANMCEEKYWNIAFWMTDELPIIGCNFEDTKEAKETTLMMLNWMTDIGITNPALQNKSGVKTIGYEILCNLIEKISPEIQKHLQQKFDSNITLLIGDFSYTNDDIERIIRINGDKAKNFYDFLKKY